MAKPTKIDDDKYKCENCGRSPEGDVVYMCGDCGTSTCFKCRFTCEECDKDLCHDCESSWEASPLCYDCFNHPEGKIPESVGS